MKEMMNNITTVLTVIAVLCFIISVITEFTKEIGIFNIIPTSLQVLILSITICTLAFFMYISYKEIAFIWYYLIGVILGSFVIALICTKGWEYVTAIWKRFYRKDINSDIINAVSNLHADRICMDVNLNEQIYEQSGELPKDTEVDKAIYNIVDIMEEDENMDIEEEFITIGSIDDNDMDDIMSEDIENEEDNLWP